MSQKPEISDTAKRIARLNDTQEFILEFSRQLQVRPTKRAAYEVVEHSYRQLFGKNKYSSFKSFERVFYRSIKRKAAEKQEQIKNLKKQKNGSS